MRFIAPALILLAVSVSTPVAAGDPQPAAPQAEERKEEAKKEKKICRRITSMGSRRSERVCMTREQWEEYNNGN
ncbi:hypothetical protein [Pontixanthobacter sp. CEM42]|uniref:hypothetical protein n=1 Tax=Pontixanthobacter sp. CEM42 TaxID=2792077 RepID=UPI001FD7ADA6|nr:hypothetical protein [Pontixanthobacter sp. CEM42]